MGAWKKQTITIAHNPTGVPFGQLTANHNSPLKDCPKMQIEAEVRGVFAIHDSVGMFDEQFTLTHIPTGRAAGRSDELRALRRLASMYLRLDERKLKSKSVRVATAALGPVYAKWAEVKK